MRASRVLGISIPDLVLRLGAYGFQVPGPDEHPEWPVDREPELLSMELEGSTPWLDVDRPVPLYHLIRAERKLGIPILDAAARLRDLGMNVPDVPAMIRAALKKVPTL